VGPATPTPRPPTAVTAAPTATGATAAYTPASGPAAPLRRALGVETAPVAKAR